MKKNNFFKSFCGKFKNNRKVVKVTKDTKGKLTKWQFSE